MGEAERPKRAAFSNSKSHIIIKTVVDKTFERCSSLIPGVGGFASIDETVSISFLGVS